MDLKVQIIKLGYKSIIIYIICLIPYLKRGDKKKNNEKMKIYMKIMGYIK
jgi:hypothetical protein